MFFCDYNDVRQICGFLLWLQWCAADMWVSSVTTMMWGRYVGFFCDYNDVSQIGGFRLELCNDVRRQVVFFWNSAMMWIEMQQPYNQGLYSPSI
jgi:hypothetical protein